MRKLLLTALLAIMVTGASAQTYLKWNSLYWVVGVPNMSVETKIGKKLTFNFDAVYSPWESIKGRPFVIGQFIPELRFYPKAANKGFYVGAYAAVDVYKLSKWGHPATEIQHGWGISLGATVGYELAIGKRWNMDFYAGGGWHLGWYWGENRANGTVYAPWNASGEWIPYKLGVTFAYRISKDKKK